MADRKGRKSWGLWEETSQVACSQTRANIRVPWGQRWPLGHLESLGQKFSVSRVEPKDLSLLAAAGALSLKCSLKSSLRTKNLRVSVPANRISLPLYSPSSIRICLENPSIILVEQRVLLPITSPLALGHSQDYRQSGLMTAGRLGRGLGREWRSASIQDWKWQETAGITTLSYPGFPLPSFFLLKPFLLFSYD